MAAANESIASPETLNVMREDFQSQSLGMLWLLYEQCIDDVESLQSRLREDPMFPEEKAATKAELERHRQYLKLYREVLLEKGWDGINKPSDEELPKCYWCRHTLTHWDLVDSVCSMCMENSQQMTYDRTEW
jgi:hypothetical protein